MATNLEIADLIDAAHDVLLSDGWCQGQAHDEADRRCSVGALMCAAIDTRKSYDTIRLAEDALAEDAGSFTILSWNDASGRTEDEVFDLFRSTAKRLREEAQQ